MLSTAPLAWAMFGLLASANVVPSQVMYSGTLVPVTRAGEGAPVREFTLTAVLLPTEDAVRGYSVISEVGGQRSHWIERIGAGTLETGDWQPGLTLQHADARHQVGLPAAVFLFPEAPHTGLSWTANELQCRVTGEQTALDRPAWKVECLGRLGQREELAVAQDDHVVLRSERRLFIGRGDEFKLRLKQESQTALDDEQLAAASSAWTQLRTLEEGLKLSERQGQTALRDEEIEQALETAAGLARVADVAGLKSISDEISRDLKRQQRREIDVAAMQQKSLGQPAPDVSLMTISGEPRPLAGENPKIQVLHFWSYDGNALEPPYGQVGYLDFLNDRRGKLGVEVLGVAVDAKFANPGERAAAVRPVQKLKSFMNLGYDVLLDDGTALEKFGDPRALGAELPLWVVIDSNRQIVHYHVGHYDIEPNEGLKPLDDAVVQAIRARRSTE